MSQQQKIERDAPTLPCDHGEWADAPASDWRMQERDTKRHAIAVELPPVQRVKSIFGDSLAIHF